MRQFIINRNNFMLVIPLSDCCHFVCLFSIAFAAFSVYFFDCTYFSSHFETIHSICLWGAPLYFGTYVNLHVCVCNCEKYICMCVHLRQKAIVCICDTRKCQYTCSTRPFRQRIAAFTVTHTANSSILLVLSHSWRLRLTSHLLCVLLTCLCHHLNRNYFCSIKFWSIATWRLQFTLSTSITAALNLATKILLRVLLTPTLQTSFCVSYWLLTRRH